MFYVRDKDGRIIRQSRNLSGIRTYAATYPAKVVSVDPLDPPDPAEDPQGKLLILFRNGASVELNFASFRVLLDAVRHWRSLYGAALICAGRPCGKVSKRNAELGNTIRRGRRRLGDPQAVHQRNYDRKANAHEQVRREDPDG